MNTLAARMTEQLRRWPPACTFALGLSYVLAFVVLDGFTPSNQTFTLWYLLGMAFVAWGAGRWPAMVLATLAAGGIFLGEHGTTEHSRWVAIWNSVSGLLILLFVGWLTAEMARLTRLLSRLVEERTAQWQAETRRHQATSQHLSEALVMAAQDITERKRAEQRLAEALELNQKMLAASPMGITAFRASGACVFANEALGRILNGPMEAILQSDFRQLESWQKSGLLQAAEEALRTGELRSGEFHVASRFGKTLWMDAHLIPFVSAGQSHLLGMCYDISERKRSEREVLEISDREQARIGQDLHDGLCQQLVSLAFDANALVGHLAAKDGPEATLARRIADLLDQTITEARNLSRGLFPVRLETDGLESALEELAKSISHRHPVRCTFAGICPPGLGDRPRAIQLYRIVQEAVNNALKHAQPKSIRIELMTQAEHYELTITDDGSGFPASGPSSPHGLGLHIMAYRARSLGGTFKAAPGPDGGTTVCCCIPRRPRSKLRS